MTQPVESDPRSRLDRWIPAVLAAVVYPPLLLTHRGMVGADTKSYLYLDPSRLLSRAPSLWDPNVGMGTVTHQNIGYLLPMGPYYWLCRAVGLPMWVSQRLWTASLLFLAGLGVVYLLRTLGWSGRAVLVAALAYALTPYVLEYEARISAILMPWSAMPWMVALLARGLRRGGWRHPAAFALVVALCGGVNATSLIYAGVAPLLWIPMTIWITGEASVGRAVGTVLRVGTLTVLTSLWWMAGLVTQAGYGLDVLRYTETVQVVAATSLPIEVLRSLGNWYFYGRDAIAAWIQPAVGYTRQIGLLTVSYLLPWLAVAGAAALRWRHKLYFVALVVVGVVLGVGVYPYNHPSPVGAVFKAFATGSSAGLALRSVGRAAPLVALGVAVLLGAGIDALSSRFSATRLNLVTALVGLLVLVNMTPLFTGQFVDNNLQRPERLPSWWVQAAAAVNQAGASTRVLELPGADFSHYRWGTTLDPVTPGIMDRPFVGRELIPYGSAPSADLLRALDRRMQEGTFEPASLGPLARLMSVGDVVLRSDLQYERFLTPRPRPTWQQFSPPPPGLSGPTTFGPPVTRATLVPLVDEANLATPSTAADPPPVAVFGVPGALPIVRTETTAAPMVLAGDGEGVVDAAAGGVLGGSGAGAGPVLYAADLGSSALQQALADGAELVLTDTNRRRAQRWGTIQDVNGYTEQAGEQPLVTDLTDNRLPLFPGATDAAFTVAQQRGVVAVRATHYGNPVSYEPWYRPALALDGDPTTAWEVGAFSDPVGERLQIDLTGPVTTDHVTLVQPVVGARERWVTSATLTFDGGAAVAVNLGDASRVAAGQTVTFPSRTFHRLDITIDAINFGRRADFSGGSGVGFSEVQIPGVRVDEYVRLPTDLLANGGTASADHRLVVVLTRKRSDPLSSFKSDEELALKRTFTLPTGRSFDIGGTARLSATATDDALDALVRGAPAAGGGVVVRASSSMAGSLAARPVSALDGQAATAWTPDLRQPVVGQWIEAAMPAPVTLDHLDLTLVADGRHSVPTRIGATIGGHTQEVAVPPIADGRAEGATVTVRVPLTPQAGSRVRVTLLALREVKAVNYFSKVPQILPVSVAELGIPGVIAPAPQTTLGSTCRTDLLQVDGHPVGVRITGAVADAVARQPLSVALCGPGSLTLGLGSHDLLATPGRATGIDLDRLILTSAPAPAAPVASPAGPAPAIRILSQGRTHLRLQVARSSSPFWLVLGESRNSGWTATIAGGHALGGSRTVDGYANGWLVRPTDLATGSGPVTVTLDWTPQHKVWIALGLSALGIILCLAILVLTRAGYGRRRVGPRRSEEPAPPVGYGAPGGAAKPQLVAPWSAAGPLLSRRARVATVLISGLAAAGVIAPVAGLIVGVVVAAALWRPEGRALLSVGAAAAIGVSALYVLELQFRYRFPSKLDWPQHFAKVVGLTWIGVALFAVDAVVQWLRDRQVASRRE